MNTYYDAASASSYEVLTDEQKEAMSDDEVDKWNTKIKDSLLRRDSTLSGLISTMKTNMMGTVTASNGKTYSLANLGITTSSKTIMKADFFILKVMKMMMSLQIQQIRLCRCLKKILIRSRKYCQDLRKIFMTV